MADESSFFEWGFKGVVSAALMAGGWLYANVVGDMKVLSKAHTDFQLDAEKRFAKEDHVNENLSKINATMTVLQNSINTNTNMTSIVMEKITAINERLKT